MQVDDGYYGEDVVVAAHLSRARRLTQSRGLEELTSIIRRKDSARGRLSGDNTVKLPPSRSPETYVSSILASVRGRSVFFVTVRSRARASQLAPRVLKLVLLGSRCPRFVRRCLSILCRLLKGRPVRVEELAQALQMETQCAHGSSISSFVVVAWGQCLERAQRRKKDRLTAGAMYPGRHPSTASH